MSVLDPTRDDLDQELFTGELLKGTVSQQILKLTESLEQFGRVMDVYIVGGILSYQWKEDSDIDVTVVMVTKDALSMEAAQKHAVAISETPAKGTKHPINFFVRGDFPIETYDGAYNVRRDELVKGPYSFSANIEQYMQYFRKQIGEMDKWKAELDRDIVDYETLDKMPVGDKKALQKRVEKKLTEIELDVNSLVDKYKHMHTLRTKVFAEPLSAQDLQKYKSKNLLPDAVVYKMLERYMYSQLAATLKELLKSTGGEIETPEQVDKVKTALRREEKVGDIEKIVNSLLEREEWEEEEEEDGPDPEFNPYFLYGHTQGDEAMDDIDKVVDKGVAYLKRLPGVGVDTNIDLAIAKWFCRISSSDVALSSVSFGAGRKIGQVPNPFLLKCPKEQEVVLTKQILITLQKMIEELELIDDKYGGIGLMDTASFHAVADNFYERLHEGGNKGMPISLQMQGEYGAEMGKVDQVVTSQPPKPPKVSNAPTPKEAEEQLRLYTQKKQALGDFLHAAVVLDVSRMERLLGGNTALVAETVTKWLQWVVQRVPMSVIGNEIAYQHHLSGGK